MVHCAGQILTSIQRRQEVCRTMSRHQTISLDFRLWHTTDVAVSDMPGYGCCSGHTVHRALHLCVLLSVFPLSWAVDGDVWGSCVGKRSYTTGSSKIKSMACIAKSVRSLWQNYPPSDLFNIPQRGSVILLFSGFSNAGWFITHSAVSSQGEHAGRSKTPPTEWLPLWEVKLNQETPDTPSGRSQDMLAAGTASAAEHSITLRPSSVCKSTRIVGGTERKGAGEKGPHQYFTVR